jgi:hypothetical protein
MDAGNCFALFRFYRSVFEINAFLSLNGRPDLANSPTNRPEN